MTEELDGLLRESSEQILEYLDRIIHQARRGLNPNKNPYDFFDEITYLEEEVKDLGRLLLRTGDDIEQELAQEERRQGRA